METKNAINRENAKISLNRTMQYGNVMSKPGATMFVEFKSYYVVWKLDPPASGDIDTLSFKSYYVVWKL